ncbi:cadherin-like beta sandwich domain-containing protein, partial [Rhizobium sp. FKL33]|uniref:cadherin-like beta sandwich domain-containing protein n=1 Tax=Rhizobium sp. FKL33 TaxID=2562307 RepID=UPI00198183E1
SPSFSSAIHSYTASVDNDVSSIKVTPTVSDANATVTVNSTTVASGAASGNLSLDVGDNTITVEVTAEDGVTTETYTVTVKRAEADSTDAMLTSLSLSSGTLSPSFSSAIHSYTVSVDNDVSSIKVTPVVSDAGATVTVNGATVTSGSTSGNLSLDVGDNTITVEVTAEDGVTTETYTVTVERAEADSTDATMTSLSLSSGSLSPSFSSAIHSYTVSVDNDVSSIKVTPVVSDANATVT